MSVNKLLSTLKLCCAVHFSVLFKLEVDASAIGAGAVLLQEDNQGIDYPVSCFSRKFNKHQLKYSTTEKEALALLLALHHFEVYLGSNVNLIKVFIDNNLLMHWSLSIFKLQP